MKLLSFNVRNRYKIKNYDGTYKNNDTVKKLSNYIIQNIRRGQTIVRIYGQSSSFVMQQHITTA